MLAAEHTSSSVTFYNPHRNLTLKATTKVCGECLNVREIHDSRIENIT
jgi:hypothetical protein